MSEEIKVGDLVMVVKPTLCCGVTDSVGKIYIVKKIEFTKSVCPNCSKITGPDWVAFVNRSCRKFSRLKKINPLTEPEHVEAQQEITV